MAVDASRRASPVSRGRMQRFNIHPVASLFICFSIAGCSDSSGPNGIPDPTVPLTLAVGGHHICRLRGDGIALCWGRADAGQVGADSTPVTSEPTPVSAGDTRFQSITAGGLHTCALTPDGEPWCWGQNDAGQAGFPTAMNQVCGNPIHGWQCVPTPQPLSTSLRFRVLYAGSANTCGSTTDGAAYCWGSSGSGQLGPGASDVCGGSPCSVSPVALPAQPQLRVLALGSGAHLCGLAADGTAYCWGSNANGQLGIGSVGGSRDIPTAVTGGTKFTAIAVGGQHTCALATDGRPWCWGADILPPGDGGVSLSPVPVAIGDSPAFADLISGTWAACGRTAGERVFCWGINYYGEMGITPSGLTTRYTTPQQMAADLRWSTIAGSHGTFCGLSPASETWCWGFGDYGELGPVHQQSAVPQRIGGV
jgi:alpha-tubulin suppressor-like RCC1 family protein